MRLAFMGTPEFAVPTLDALVAAGHDVTAVYTQPPRPANRGKKLTPSAVQQRAEELGLCVRSPLSLRQAEAQADFAALALDIAIVAAYGLILPPAVLEAPTYGCLNVHGSLLPRWRGAAPVQRAILAGDAKSGVMVIQMEAGLDTGPVRATTEIEIGHKTTGQLTMELAELGAELMVRVLADLAAFPCVAQPEEGVTYAAKIDKQEALIDWSLPATLLSRRIRAFDPFPGAHTLWQGQTLKVWSALALPQTTDHAPGTVVQAREQGLDVACGEGVLRLLQLQKPGAKRLAFAELLRGHADWQGVVLGQ